MTQLRPYCDKHRESGTRVLLWPFCQMNPTGNIYFLQYGAKVETEVLPVVPEAPPRTPDGPSSPLLLPVALSPVSTDTSSHT
ncbi:JM107 [macacine gammaherpesvirus 11]|uniref:JM107 n=2 Tax=macacine gammaherpesvirus 11 TaxID=2560570 RepID=G9JMT5_9GAMA|nr:JM107 [Macaca fuscata rhadinovirus]AAT00084.1 JM107 [Macaca fuscata rhadinovirus]AEW87632.1 JM107 [Macaca fuscata rhadinovirus]AEW87802.1 JM107 [Macaca fuscata rhadinovirus]